MASKYVTDDGLDLDSRYLGINAKAKSAETADTATSVEWEGVNNVPTFWPKINFSNPVSFSSKNWTVPSNGLALLDDGGKVNNRTMNYVSARTTGSYSEWVDVVISTSVPVFVSAGDVINGVGDFYPAA